MAETLLPSPVPLVLSHQHFSSEVMGLNAPAAHGGGCSYTLLSEEEALGLSCFASDPGLCWDPFEMMACSLPASAGAQHQTVTASLRCGAGCGFGTENQIQPIGCC